MIEEQQDLPIDFNLISLYIIGNIAGSIAGNITGIIIYRDIKPFIYLKLFEGGAYNYNKPFMT